MTAYLDTSALAKRYDPSENNAAVVVALFTANPRPPVYTSSLTAPELASALRRKQNRGDLSPNDVRLAWNAFGLHSGADYALLAPDSGILRSAERLVFAHGLRAHDAVQLATALRLVALAGLAPSDLEFYTADAGLAMAVRLEGLTERAL